MRYSVLSIHSPLQTQQTSVEIPRRRYENGAGRGLQNNQNLASFVLEDGSYVPVTAALGDYVGLLNHDLPGFPGEAGLKITLRFEMNKPHRSQ